MTVFKYFFKVLKKYQFMIIIYTVILLVFGATSITNNQSTNFVASKPDILIINEDEQEGITQDLITYLSMQANVKTDIKNKEDALFYRDISYVINIPKGYRSNYLNGQILKIDVEKLNDSNASYMDMVLNRYLNLARIYINENEEIAISKINEILNNHVDIKIDSHIDTNSYSKAANFYNFSSYSLLAGCVFVIATVLSSFHDSKIKKRMNITPTKYKQINFELLLGNFLFALVLWLFYVILSFILIGKAMLSIHGILYIINSFLFLLCSLTLAFLIGTITNNKNAINGITNVVALGCSFLCGVFVPQQYLPDSILKIAHILPSYWYVMNNNLISSLETINIETLNAYFKNSFVLIIFILVFVILTNIISRQQRVQN